MATDMYDAYGSEQPTTMGGVAKDLAMSPFKMATYAGLYTQWPGMYSIGKGVWIPYIGKNLEKGGMSAVATGAKSLISQAYSQKGVWGKVAGTVSLAKEFGKRTVSLGKVGGGYVGENWMNKNIERRLERSKRVFEGRLYQKAKTFYGDEVRAQDAAKKATDAMMKGKLAGKFNIKGPGFQMSEMIDAKSIGGFQQYNKALAYKSKRTIAKMALGAAKGASFIGGAMLAWDLISMVGEPIGRAAVRGLDNLMGEYQRRFLPETGGRLELSYLSQGAATERQRAVQAISKSYINGRSAFGNEAQYLHQ